MNILITGGAGFIGSHVVDACIEQGHAVSVIDDLSTGASENLNPQAEFHKRDIRDRGLEGIFQRRKFDVVVHHAAQMDVRHSVRDPQFDASVNIIGTLNLFESARAAGVRKFIFASTGGAIYGEQIRFPADEDHPTNPMSPYGVSKLAVEKYLNFYHTVYGIGYVILRYANVYGPRQRPDGEAGVVAIFGKKMINGDTPTINGDGTQTRDFTFVRDVVRANMFALEFQGTEIFNVGTGVESDINAVFRTLKKELGVNTEERHGPAKEGEQLRSVISSAKLERMMKWKPSVRLEEGLTETAAWFRKKS